MNNIEIREIEEGDNQIVAHIIRKIFEEYDAPRFNTVYSDPATDDLYSSFKTDKSAMWVALLDGKAVGSCGIFPTAGLPDNCAELVKFYMSAEARSRGIGKLLYAKSMESAKMFGYTRIYLESLPQFAGAVNMYKKEGFMFLDAPMGESGHNACNIWMIKEL